MSGPLPADCPTFPAPFVHAAQQMASKRTVAYQLRQRAELVVLLSVHPTLSNVAAGAQVDLHPNTVRHWRRRWARGEFTLQDQAGRGRKSPFSPSGADVSQSLGLRSRLRHRATGKSPLDERPEPTSYPGIRPDDQP